MKEQAMSLEHYAQGVHERVSLIADLSPYTVSRRGELAYLVLDWYRQGYPEKRILATLKHFRESVEDRGYADTITAFLREYGAWQKQKG